MRVWDRPGFEGNSIRLWGPADFPLLRVAERTWRAQIMSIVIGPGAYVQFYEDLNFEQSVQWLMPKQRIENVEALECGDEMDSLRIFDRAPFARERGFAAYVRAIGQSQADGGKGENEMGNPVQRVGLRVLGG